jgi:hypothetical protein
MSKTSAAARARTARARRRAPSRGSDATRRNAPRVLKGEPSKERVTIVIAPSDLAWVEQEAERLQTSVSAVIGAGVVSLKRDAAWKRCFAAIGDADELTDEERARFDAEFRELGLIS